VFAVSCSTVLLERKKERKKKEKKRFFLNNRTVVQNIALECVLHIGEELWFKR
jgi:hypothetical protein